VRPKIHGDRKTHDEAKLAQGRFHIPTGPEKVVVMFYDCHQSNQPEEHVVAPLLDEGRGVAYTNSLLPGSGRGLETGDVENDRKKGKKE
jgi:hypothetical protein